MAKYFSLFILVISLSFLSCSGASKKNNVLLNQQVSTSSSYEELQKAILKGDIVAFDALVSNGADVNEQGKGG